MTQFFFFFLLFSCSHLIVQIFLRNFRKLYSKFIFMSYHCLRVKFVAGYTNIIYNFFFVRYLYAHATLVCIINLLVNVVSYGTIEGKKRVSQCIDENQHICVCVLHQQNIDLPSSFRGNAANDDAGAQICPPACSFHRAPFHSLALPVQLRRPSFY